MDHDVLGPRRLRAENILAAELLDRIGGSVRHAPGEARRHFATTFSHAFRRQADGRFNYNQMLLKLDRVVSRLFAQGGILGDTCSLGLLWSGMPSKFSRHIALTGPLADWVDSQVATGEYASVSDLVRTAIRFLRERDDTRIGRTTIANTGGNKARQSA